MLEWLYMATTALTDSHKFLGFSQPTTTPVPDEIFDVLAPLLTDAELRVLFYIVRRTFGFKRTSDSISLTQMATGITTKDGRCLDHGTGMTRRGAMKGCAGLVAKGIVVVEKRRSPRGDSDVNVYRLRFREAPGTGVGNQGAHRGERRSPGVGNQGTPQQTGKQETVLQQHDGALMQELADFGVTPAAAKRLVAAYPTPYLADKLDIARWLVRAKSRVIATNPAGYLRRSIEDHYAPPPGYQNAEQRAAVEARRVELEARAKATFERAAERQRRARPEDSVELLCPPRAIPGTNLDTRTVWEQLLRDMQERVSPATFSTLLRHTSLASCDAHGALVVAPNAIVIDLLRRRLEPGILRALSRSLGFAVPIKYATLADLKSAPDRPPRAAESRLASDTLASPVPA